MSPALADRFLTTAPPGKSPNIILYPRQIKTYVHTNPCTFIAALFTVPKRANNPNCPNNLGMDKHNVLHAYNGILFSSKKRIPDRSAETERKLGIARGRGGGVRDDC